MCFLLVPRVPYMDTTLWEADYGAGVEDLAGNYDVRRGLGG